MCNTRNENYIGESTNNNQKVRTRQKEYYINLHTPCTSLLTCKEVNMLMMETISLSGVWWCEQCLTTFTLWLTPFRRKRFWFGTSGTQSDNWQAGNIQKRYACGTLALQRKEINIQQAEWWQERAGGKNTQRNAVSRMGEGVRQRGGMMCLTVSVGFLLNKLLPQILGTFADKFSLIKVTEMPTCLHTSIKCWYICHSQWKSSKGF